MDLNSQAVHDVVHPTGAFVEKKTAQESQASAEELDGLGGQWELSQLNPKNRIDSLDDLERPLWRIDGCTGLGTQFFAVPLFLKPPPIRVDVFVPEDTPPALRRLLRLNEAFHTKDRLRVSQLPICKLIIRRLQQWTLALDNPSMWYTSLPFGSRIVFENIQLDIAKIRVRVAPMHNLESQLITAESLLRMWKDDGISLPQQISLDQIELVQQLHDSVSIVRIDNGPRMILKALTSYPKYLYLELRNLLRVGPHLNVVQRPVYLVTKRSNFGNKNAVVGFLLNYHQAGSLRDILPFRRIHHDLSYPDQIKWAIQVTRGLLHLHESCSMFYPDLRLDNLVLSQDEDIVMVDFEQRGVWCEFSAPEVNFLEYILLLARSDSVQGHVRPRMEQRIQDMVSTDLDRFYTAKYDASLAAYNVAWLCLDRREQEMAEVFMLGRVLWCIFEAVSAPQKAAVWQSYRWESDVEFPDFRRTPGALRPLIDSCTRGRRPSLGEKVGRVGGRLVVLDQQRRAEDPVAEDPVAEAAEVGRVARAWWADEVKHAEEFLDRRKESMLAGTWDGNPFDRPSLSDVLRALKELQ